MEARRWAVIPCVIVAGLLLSGCRSEIDADATDLGPWASEILALHASTTSDFVRSVTEDGVLDREEAREALYRFVACQQDSGIPRILVEFDDFFGIALEDQSWSGDSVPGPYRNTVVACAEQWIGDFYGRNLWDLWELNQTNQLNLNSIDFLNAQAACLSRNGAAPDGFTGRELEHLMDELLSGLGTEGIGNDFSQEELDTWLAAQRAAAPTHVFGDGTRLWFGSDIWHRCFDPFFDVDPNEVEVERTNLGDITAACLIREGLAPDGFTGADLDALYEEYARLPTIEERADPTGLNRNEFRTWLAQFATTGSPTHVFEDGTELWFGQPQVTLCFPEW